MFAQVCAGGDKGGPEKIPKNNDEDKGGPEGCVVQYTFLCVKVLQTKGVQRTNSGNAGFSIVEV